LQGFCCSYVLVGRVVLFFFRCQTKVQVGS
jgi:hypothetical protein